MYVRKLGFFEIAGDVKAVKVYKCHDRLAGCGVGPWPECEVGDDAIDRSANLSASQVDTGQFPVGKRLGVAGASFLRRRDRKSTRLNYSHYCDLVSRPLRD